MDSYKYYLIVINEKLEDFNCWDNLDQFRIFAKIG